MAPKTPPSGAVACLNSVEHVVPQSHVNRTWVCAGFSRRQRKVIMIKYLRQFSNNCFCDLLTEFIMSAPITILSLQCILENTSGTVSACGYESNYCSKFSALLPVDASN